eukprot:CFRG7893T1
MSASIHNLPSSPNFDYVGSMPSSPMLSNMSLAFHTMPISSEEHSPSISTTSLFHHLDELKEKTIKSCSRDELLYILKYRNSSEARDFYTFLKAEHSEELVLFFWKCEDWKEYYDRISPGGREQSILKLSAKEIYESFIQKDAPFEININEKLTAQIKEDVESGNPPYKTFDDAQNRAYHLLLKNKINRFEQFKTKSAAVKTQYNPHMFEYLGFVAHNPLRCSKCNLYVLTNIVRCEGCHIVCHVSCSKEVLDVGLICTGKSAHGGNIYEVLPATNSRKICSILGGVPIAPINAPNKFNSTVLGAEGTTQSVPSNYGSQDSPPISKPNAQQVTSSILRSGSCKPMADVASTRTVPRCENGMKRNLSSRWSTEFVRTRTQAMPSEDPHEEDIYAPGKAARFLGVIPTRVQGDVEGKPLRTLGTFNDSPPSQYPPKARQLLGNSVNAPRNFQA